MKRFMVLSAVLCLLSITGVAQADVCNLDVTPAATLLLPYFEVDISNPAGANTIFSIGNASSPASLVNVAVWSDLSVPIFNFNVYLTGYDMEVLDLRDIIVNGNLPATATAGQDFGDLISPHGPVSQDINFASCSGILPPAPLPLFALDHIQDSLTGLPSSVLGGQCAGRELGDGIARGYITVDVVSRCTLLFPSDPGYFAPEFGGIAYPFNVLFGDFTITNPTKRTAIGMPLVHIEASTTAPETSTPGQYTFYGRYVNWSAADYREPLATTFGARYVGGDSDFIVWRDSKVAQGPFQCPAANGRPAWFRMGHESIVAFDLEENVVSPTTLPFPAETQRTPVGGSRLPIPFDAGWAFLNLNTAAGANPVEDPTATQAWVGVVITGDNARLASGFDAMRYDTACNRYYADPAPGGF